MKAASPFGLMADLHLHAWSSFATVTPEGQNSRLSGLLDEIKRCAKDTHSVGGLNVIMAGDVFHVRGAVSPSVLNSLKDCLAYCNNEYGTEFIVLAGNHDLEYKNATRLGSAVTALECEYVLVVNEATSATSDIFMLPWFDSVDELKKVLTEWTTGNDVSEVDLILHAPIDGVIKGLPSHGLTPEWLAELGYRRVFSGHYHNHKKFPGDIYSIGALAHHTWSDVGSKAGFLIVYPDRISWQKSHLPEFIDLSQLLDLDPEDIPLMVDQNYVRVKVEASKTKEVEAARQELIDMGAKAVIVQAMPKPPAREGFEHATVASGGSLEVSVTEFIKGMPSVPTEDVTKAAFAVLASVDALGD